MEPVSLISLNIERGRHLDMVVPFLERERPDVFCVQELREMDIPAFERAAGALVSYAPMAAFPDGDGHAVIGVGIFSRLPFTAPKAEYYYGSREDVKRYDPAARLMERALAYADFEKGGEAYRIGTTHFTWSHDGVADDNQRRDIKRLLEVLAAAGDLVFAGDFNAPRGREIFALLAEKYADNVPQMYTSSIDPTFHRAPETHLMVDGIFSTPAYAVSEVSMERGVSDHCALRAKVACGSGVVS